MSPRRVVVTGVGMVTPLGVGTYESWSALAAGGSGVAWANLLGEQSALRHPAALVPEFPIQRYVTNRKLLRLMGRSDRFALAAAQMAISEAPPDGIHPERRGAFTATRKEIVPIESLFDVVRGSWDDTRTMDSVRLGRDGFGLIPPLTLVLGLPNGCLFALSVLHTVHGANTNFLGSGEVGLAAVAAAYQAVREGSVDWAVAGGHDSGADRWAYADFHRLGLLCQPSGDPARSVRPLDRRRSGFALGEGAAMVVVEAVVRLLPGVLGSEESPLDDSHVAGLLEYPHYTRPAVFRGWPVPEVLLSGNHAEIARWRREQAIRRTLARRPELLAQASLTAAERKLVDTLRSLAGATLPSE